jgi:hypothetical protein
MKIMSAALLKPCLIKDRPHERTATAHWLASRCDWEWMSVALFGHEFSQLCIIIDAKMAGNRASCLSEITNLQKSLRWQIEEY